MSLLMDAPQDVAIVEFDQHAVLAELRLPLAVGLPGCQVLVHFLQALETLGHVLVVYLGVERRHGLLAQVVCAVDVEAGALLDQ